MIWAVMIFGGLAAFLVFEVARGLMRGQVFARQAPVWRAQAPVDYWIELAAMAMVAGVCGIIAITFAAGWPITGRAQLFALALLVAAFMALDVMRALRTGDVGRFGYTRSNNPRAFWAMTSLSGLTALLLVGYLVWVLIGMLP